MKTHLFWILVLSANCNLCQAEGAYDYPLKPGTTAWASATALQRVNSAYIPESWRRAASSRQLFLSAVANPFFREILDGATANLDTSYTAARETFQLNAILTDTESTSDFGYQAFDYLHSLSISGIAASQCQLFNGPCWEDYIMVCYLAGRTSAQNTIDLTSDKTLFKLAVWDASYFISLGQRDVAAADVQLMYVIYNGGRAPSGISLPVLSTPQAVTLQHSFSPPDLDSIIASIKSTLGVTARP